MLTGKSGILLAITEKQSYLLIKSTYGMDSDAMMPKVSHDNLFNVALEWDNRKHTKAPNEKLVCG